MAFRILCHCDMRVLTLMSFPRAACTASSPAVWNLVSKYLVMSSSEYSSPESAGQKENGLKVSLTVLSSKSYLQLSTKERVLISNRGLVQMGMALASSAETHASGRHLSMCIVALLYFLPREPGMLIVFEVRSMLWNVVVYTGGWCISSSRSVPYCRYVGFISRDSARSWIGEIDKKGGIRL